MEANSYDHLRMIKLRDSVHGWIVYTVDTDSTRRFGRAVLGVNVELDSPPFTTVVYRYPEAGEYVRDCMAYEWPTPMKALEGHDMIVTQIAEDPDWAYAPTHHLDFGVFE